MVVTLHARKTVFFFLLVFIVARVGEGRSPQKSRTTELELRCGTREEMEPRCVCVLTMNERRDRGWESLFVGLSKKKRSDDDAVHT